MTSLRGVCANLTSADNTSMIAMSWGNHSLTVVFVSGKEGKSWYFQKIAVEVGEGGEQLGKKFFK